LTDGVTSVVPGTADTYTIVVTNNGPNAAVDAAVTDLFPAAITAASWTAVASAGSSVTFVSGTGNINAVPVTLLLPGGTATFTVVAQISPSATGLLTNTVAVAAPPGVTDTNPGNNTATDTDTLAVDPGPSVTDTTTAGEKVAHGTTVAVGTAAPGLSGDTLTLTEVSGPPGAVALSGGTVSFAAPANASGNVAFSYQISDQLGDLSAVISDTLAVDPGPTIASVTPAVVKQGQSTGIGTVAPGLAGDTLTLTKTSGSGALALKLVGSVEEVIYTAPVTVAASTLDAVSYTVTDQLGGTATGSSTIPVASGTSSIIVGTAGHAVSAGNSNSVIDGRAGNEAIQAGNGTDFVLGGPNDTIQVGNGSDEIIGGTGNSITAGNADSPASLKKSFTSQG
jgi:uncharacterized repeat protein (TIGR01451 family)